MKFKARLDSVGPGGAWTFLTVPPAVEKTLGTRARVPVKGTINGFAFRASLFPTGEGTHCLMVNKAMQKGAGAAPGDTVLMVLEVDAEPRTVAVPRDFQKALARNKTARANFEKFAYSHKKAYVDWIESAKKEETRLRRLEKAVAMLAEGQKFDD